MTDRQSTAAALASVATKLDGLASRMDRDAVTTRELIAAITDDHKTLAGAVTNMATQHAAQIEQDKYRDERMDRIEATVGDHGQKLGVLDSLRAKAIGAGMVLGAIGTVVMLVWQAARDRILTAIGWHG